MTKTIFNLILNNILYDIIWNKGKEKVYIWQNDIQIEKKDNQINFSINWLSNSISFEKDNYSNFCLMLVEWLEHIINWYLIECEKENYTKEQILEMWND